MVVVFVSVGTGAVFAQGASQHVGALGRWGAMASFNAFIWIGRAAGLRLPELRSRQAVDALVLVGQAEE